MSLYAQHILLAVPESRLNALVHMGSLLLSVQPLMTVVILEHRLVVYWSSPAMIFFGAQVSSSAIRQIHLIAWLNTSLNLTAHWEVTPVLKQRLIVYRIFGAFLFSAQHNSRVLRRNLIAPGNTPPYIKGQFQ